VAGAEVEKSVTAAELSAVRLEAYRCTAATARTRCRWRNEMVTRARATQAPRSIVSVVSFATRGGDGDASLTVTGCSGGLDADETAECDGDGIECVGDTVAAEWCRVDLIDGDSV
jgi:hypothetical protein